MSRTFFKILSITIITSLLIACNSKVNLESEKAKAPPKDLSGHKLVFYKLDDYAKIIINGVLVYDTSEDGLNPDNGVTINLNPYLKKGDYTLLVEIHNAPCEDCLNGNSWEVVYDYYIEGELIDYVVEKSESDYLPHGLSYSKTYKSRFKN